jgi:hypothetical protein
MSQTLSVLINTTSATQSLIMQTVLRKIKSLPLLLRRETQGEVQEMQGEGQEPLGEEQTPQSTLLSYPQLMQQIDMLEELVDTMLDDAKNDMVLFFRRNESPDKSCCLSRTTTTHCLVPSEALTPRLLCKCYNSILISSPFNDYSTGYESMTPLPSTSTENKDRK